jgi:nucleotide-binding universal stress UspA family protein
MHNGFLERGQNIVVAVAFDAHTPLLVRAGADLARRLSKTLVLAHVVEPWQGRTPARPFGEQDPLWNATQAVEADARETAEQRLAALADTVDPNVVVRRRLVVGKPIEVLTAGERDDALLIVGADFGNLRFTPRGFSTALSLMVSAPVPVLVIDTAASPELLSETPRLLVADDLGPDSEAAVEFGFALGTALGPSEVHHVHVNGLALDSVAAGLEAAAATAHTPLPSTDAARDVYTALVGELKERLEGRAEGLRDYLEAAQGRYVPQIETGRVVERLGDVADQVAPDVLVFGKHHAYHTRPFFLGRVPYRAMLAHRRPVVVVPNA